MKLIIDTDKIKDLLEIEWGYEGIRGDLDNLFLKNGIPLEQIRAEINGIEINGQIDEHTMFIRTGEQGKQMALDIIDKYTK